MPRGIPKVKAVPPEAGLEALGAGVEKSVRSRDEIEADKHTEEFLKRNRPNLAGFEQHLAYFGERAGWVRHWAVDRANRVQSLLERGWRFVLRSEVGMSDSIGHGNTDIGGFVSISTTLGEGPCRQILMETPKKIFDMQMEAQMEPVRKSEAAIRAGAFAVQDTGHVYQPKGVVNRLETNSTL